MGLTPSRPQPASPKSDTSQSNVESSTSTSSSTTAGALQDSFSTPGSSPGRFSTTTPAYNVFSSKSSLTRSRSSSRGSNAGASSLGGDYVVIENTQSHLERIMNSKQFLSPLEVANAEIGGPNDSFLTTAEESYAASVESAAKSFKQVKETIDELCTVVTRNISSIEEQQARVRAAKFF